MSFATSSLVKMSLATMSLGTMSLSTMSLGTMSLRTMSLRTIVPCDNCSLRQFFLRSFTNGHLQRGRSSGWPKSRGRRSRNCCKWSSGWSGLLLSFAYVICKEHCPQNDQNQRDGEAQIVANDHLDDPASSVLLRSFANGHLQQCPSQKLFLVRIVPQFHGHLQRGWFSRRPKSRGWRSMDCCK